MFELCYWNSEMVADLHVRDAGATLKQHRIDVLCLDVWGSTISGFGLLM